ncbi:9167_t:CDS:2, partial [Racocetra persica]
DSAKTYEKYNIRESYRNKFELACLTSNFKRSRKEPISRSIQKKCKNQVSNEKNEDSISTLTMVPMSQEQDNYIE